MTLRCTTWLITGVVLIWHSYRPLSDSFTMENSIYSSDLASGRIYYLDWIYLQKVILRQNFVDSSESLV